MPRAHTVPMTGQSVSTALCSVQAMAVPGCLYDVADAWASIAQMRPTFSFMKSIVSVNVSFVASSKDAYHLHHPSGSIWASNGVRVFFPQFCS
ncbi:hypothetical protein BCR44DRAFT_1427042 [Catenaria anguillulae PL171]|uniref:Uncharacterized protein n=1 Tax=Catenaria anguillulae PL171 TaxID=765915 RepID=A0A1Y2HWP9_9FUNG|nr:hypothetical protein BCR44DRAFT_1427042 [Catenaria anguillulae PL171]